MYAVAERYDEGKMLVVPVDRFIDFKPKFPKTHAFLCYWSSNLQDSVEDLECGYAKKFTGEPSIFRVSIKTTTDSIEEAENYIKGAGRVSKMPKRFRDPGKTDAEIKKIEAKKRRSNKKELKEVQAKAQALNMEYLTKDIQLHPVSNKTHTEHTVTSAEAQENKEKETDELLSSDLPLSNNDDRASNWLELTECNYDECLKKLMNDEFDFHSNIDEITESTEVESNAVTDTTDEEVENSIKELSKKKESVTEFMPEVSILSNHVNDSHDPSVLIYESQNLMEEPLESVETVEQLTTPEVLKPADPVNNEEIVIEQDNLIILNFDELTRKNAEQELEITNLKTDLECSNKRNLLLQKYLVAADDRLAETIYVEKDGGRLYRGGVFISKAQCVILDKAKTDREYLNYLGLSIFGSNTLPNSSITGAPSNKTKGKGKQKLDPEKLQLVYDIMDARSVTNKTEKLSKSKKNSIIGKKCTNGSASADKRKNAE